MRAIQDLYPDDAAHCYGCGRLNEAGLHVRTVWRGGQGAARFEPRPSHVAMPGYVYGGLLASLEVRYLKPTPMGEELVLRARPEEMGDRKVRVSVEVEAAGEVTARGVVQAVWMPESFVAGADDGVPGGGS